MNTPIYCISGLGADYRVFANLENDFNLVHIPWIEPEKNESLSKYAHRLVADIPFPDEFYLLGLSFGGVVAQELKEKIKSKKLVLLSTFTADNGVRWYQKLLIVLKLNYLFHPALFSFFSSLNGFVFGAKTPEQKRLLTNIIKETSINFFRWSTSALKELELAHQDGPVLQIHGTKDRVIPHKNNYQVQLVEGAGHFLTLTHPSEIKAIFNEHLT